MTSWHLYPCHFASSPALSRPILRMTCAPQNQLSCSLAPTQKRTSYAQHSPTDDEALSHGYGRSLPLYPAPAAHPSLAALPSQAQTPHPDMHSNSAQQLRPYIVQGHERPAHRLSNSACSDYGCPNDVRLYGLPRTGCDLRMARQAMWQATIMRTAASQTSPPRSGAAGAAPRWSQCQPCKTVCT